MAAEVEYVGAVKPPYADRVTQMRAASLFVRVKKILLFTFVGAFLGGLIYGAGLLIEINWLQKAGFGLAAIVFLMGLYLGLAGKVASCPYCDETIGDGSTDALALSDEPEQTACPHCHELLVVENGKVRALRPEDEAFSAPYSFAAVRDGVWPSECVTCGVAPTRFEEAKLQEVEYEKLLIGKISVQSAKVSNIPYCDHHGGDVSLEVKDNMLRLRFPRLEMGRRYLAVNRGKRAIAVD
ncbi:MAG: hypothetical protein MRY74_02070 [Neomegalonema sp.]|nr:hypothetical protein [Neomegalonema sp.]